MGEGSPGEYSGVSWNEGTPGGGDNKPPDVVGIGDEVGDSGDAGWGKYGFTEAWSPAKKFDIQCRPSGSSPAGVRAVASYHMSATSSSSTEASKRPIPMTS